MGCPPLKPEMLPTGKNVINITTTITAIAPVIAPIEEADKNYGLTTTFPRIQFKALIRVSVNNPINWTRLAVETHERGMG